MTHFYSNSKPTAEIVYVCDDSDPWKLKQGTRILAEATTELRLRRTAIAKQFTIIEKQIKQDNKPNLNYWMAHLV